MSEEKRILWLSRHYPSTEQIKGLREIFGEIEIVQVSENIYKVDRVHELMKEHKAQELVTSLPLSLLGRLASSGLRPIKPILTRNPDEFGTPQYIHKRFDVIKSVQVVSQPLHEMANPEVIYNESA